MSDPHGMNPFGQGRPGGVHMQLMLVVRQLSGVIDAVSGRITRRFGLTPHDVLVLGWMAERPGISGSLMAQYIARPRQSVHRSLVRLEHRELVERYESCVRDRTSGWGLTAKGQELWEALQRAYLGIDERLTPRGISLKSLVGALGEVVAEFMRAGPRNTWSNLVEVPEEEEAPDWDV